MSFVDAIAGFRHLLKQEDLDKALSMCTGLKGQLKNKFIVLSDDRVLPPYQGRSGKRQHPGDDQVSGKRQQHGAATPATGANADPGRRPPQEASTPATGANAIPAVSGASIIIPSVSGVSIINPIPSGSGLISQPVSSNPSLVTAGFTIVKSSRQRGKKKKTTVDAAMPTTRRTQSRQVKVVHAATNVVQDPSNIVQATTNVERPKAAAMDVTSPNENYESCGSDESCDEERQLAGND